MKRCASFIVILLCIILAGRSDAQNKVFSLWGQSWIADTAVVSPTAYDAAGVSTLSKGFRFDLAKTKTVRPDASRSIRCGARLTCAKPLGYGTYVFEVAGPLWATDPRFNVAIWMHDWKSRQEISILEATRWGDPNNPLLYYTTWHWDDSRADGRGFPARAFSYHRITAVIAQKAISVVIEGRYDRDRGDGRKWMVVAERSFAGEFTSEMVVKVGAWWVQDGPYYTAVANQGVRSFDWVGFTFAPP